MQDQATPNSAIGSQSERRVWRAPIMVEFDVSETLGTGTGQQEGDSSNS
ncbi:hypothetical protein GCM10008942_39620 [Rhizomicrobium electricum]|jgi:hypothetical protein|uniref:Uncharacterized protein n=1 Tax=Rhizomicrobium electricum TaxID=480070 RepID=A0ABP3QAJ6_9PROT|nr:hypothetical protein [Rhizomicrobium electricum]